jgi:hypothetical protein
VEGVGDIRPERHRQLEGLADVPEVGLTIRRELSDVDERPHVRPDSVAPLIARHEAESREDAGRRWDEHRFDPELLGQRTRMQRPGPTEGNEGEAAGIVTALHGHDPKRPCHLRVDDVDHCRRVERAEGSLRGGAVEPDTTRQRLRQPAEREVRVGHRRARPAPPVACRPRVGARALRSNLQRPALVEPRDGAPAGADGVNVHRRQANRTAPDVPFDRPLRLAVRDEADVSRGAAHVERDRVVEAGEAGDQARSDDAAGRP